MQHRQATEKQKLLHAKILKVSDVDLLCKEGSDEYQALPLERKVKKVVVGAYILRQRKDAYLRFMKWYKAKEHYKVLSNPNYKHNPKYYEYDHKIPKYEEIVKYLDDFLNKGVTNELITWSEKAKKERKSKIAAQRRKSKLQPKEQEELKEQQEQAEAFHAGETSRLGHNRSSSV